MADDKAAIRHDAAMKAWDKRGRAQDAGGANSQSSRGDFGPSVRPPAEPKFDPSKGMDTQDTFRRPDGTWSPERQALHDRIVEKALEGIPPSKDPTVHVLGGGPASGKTSLVKSSVNAEIPRDGDGTAAWSNPDAVRRQLPEWGPLSGNEATRGKAGSFTQEEASHVSKRIVAEATRRGLDVVVDATGDGGYDSMAAKVAGYRQHGHKVVGNYVTIPTEVAWARADARAKNPKSEDFGRPIPQTYFRGVHKAVSRDFERQHSLFDKVSLYDTSGPIGSRPSLIAHGGKGKPFTVVDSGLWKAFKDKQYGPD